MSVNECLIVSSRFDSSVCLLLKDIKILSFSVTGERWSTADSKWSRKEINYTTSFMFRVIVVYLIYFMMFSLLKFKLSTTTRFDKKLLKMYKMKDAYVKTK